MFFIHEKEANSILTKSRLKHLVAVIPSILNFNSFWGFQKNEYFGGYEEYFWVLVIFDIFWGER